MEELWVNFTQYTRNYQRVLTPDYFFNKAAKSFKRGIKVPYQNFNQCFPKQAGLWSKNLIRGTFWISQSKSMKKSRPWSSANQLWHKSSAYQVLNVFGTYISIDQSQRHPLSDSSLLDSYWSLKKLKYDIFCICLPMMVWTSACGLLSDASLDPATVCLMMVIMVSLSWLITGLVNNSILFCFLFCWVFKDWS